MVDACATFRTFRQPFKESLSWHGGDFNVDASQVHGGAVKAYRPDGTLVWEWRSRHPIVASLLSTAGGLVFVGTPDGIFIALDARSGRELWRFRTGSGIHSNPITYSVNGTQYIAVPTGAGGWMKGFSPELLGHERGSTLFAFALANAAAPAAGQSSGGASR